MFVFWTSVESFSNGTGSGITEIVRYTGSICTSMFLYQYLDLSVYTGILTLDNNTVKFVTRLDQPSQEISC